MQFDEDDNDEDGSEREEYDGEEGGNNVVPLSPIEYLSPLSTILFSTSESTSNSKNIALVDSSLISAS